LESSTRSTDIDGFRAMALVLTNAGCVKAAGADSITSRLTI
jgi:hypothetical protein